MLLEDGSRCPTCDPAGINECRAGLFLEDRLDALDAVQTKSRAVAMVGDEIRIPYQNGPTLDENQYITKPVS